MSGIVAITWLAAAAGILGTVLLALKGPHAGWGFAAFLVSNGGWITFALVDHNWALLVQQIAFTFTSVLGIWTWLIAPVINRRVKELFDLEEESQC